MLTSQERTLAGIAHLTSLAMGIGLPLPIAFWQESREKSSFTAYHSLQALGYQSLGYTVWLLVYMLIVILMIPVFVLVVSLTDGGEPGIFFGIWMAVFLLVIFSLLGIYFLLPIIAAVACFMGKDFRYPILGPRLAKYLDYDFSDPEKLLNDEHSEHWVAAMGHFSVIIILWSMLAPLTAWFMDKRHSAYLRFQSIQTLLYQGIGTVAYFAFGAVYFFSIIGLLLASGGNPDRLPTEVILAFVLVILCIAAILLLLGPAYHILGQWAGYRTLKGDNFRYPLVAKLVEKWIK
jgi:uncharacterized Tic20 family protein